MTQRHKVSKSCWKNYANRFAQWRVVTIFNLFQKKRERKTASAKFNKVKCNKTWYACTYHMIPFTDGVRYNYRNKTLNSVCQGLGIQGKDWLQSSRRREFQGGERLFYLDCAIGCWLHNTEFLKTYQKHWILPKVNFKSE